MAIVFNTTGITNGRKANALTDSSETEQVEDIDDRPEYISDHFTILLGDIFVPDPVK